MAIPVCALVLIGHVPAVGTWRSAAEAATWTRQYIRHLPDTAFASLERAPDGRTVRHLPHHDTEGNLDIPHLCSALGRLNQVKWTEPGSAEAAHTHLQEHLAGLERNPCRPAPGSTR